MDNSLFGQSDIQANFNFYLTQAGVDNDGDGIELRYAQGNGVVEFADTNGSVAGTFDPAVTGWHSLDISPAVQQAADNNWSYLRLNMYPDDWRNGTDRIFVAASENSGFEPTVTIVPEPTTAMILFFMVGGSFFARRR